MVITALPVPPPPVRPSVMMDSSARCEDDLTFKLAEIVKANRELKKHAETGARFWRGLGGDGEGFAAGFGKGWEGLRGGWGWRR